MHRRLEAGSLQDFEFAESHGNFVQGAQDARGQILFHDGKGHVDLSVVVVIVVVIGLAIANAGRKGVILFVIIVRVIAAAVRAELVVGALEVDDLAQKDLFVQQFLAPDRDGSKRQWALAQALDHGVPTGFDPLGDRDFALAGQQLDLAHLAEIHPDRVVRPVELLGRRRCNDDALLGTFRNDGDFATFLFFGVVAFTVDDVDAHPRQHRHHVLDLLRRHLVLGKNFVQLVVGDVSARAGIGNHLPDSRLTQVDHGIPRILVIGSLAGVICLGCHMVILGTNVAATKDRVGKP